MIDSCVHGRKLKLSFNSKVIGSTFILPFFLAFFPIYQSFNRNPCSLWCRQLQQPQRQVWIHPTPTTQSMFKPKIIGLRSLSSTPDFLNSNHQESLNISITMFEYHYHTITIFQKISVTLNVIHSEHSSMSLYGLTLCLYANGHLWIDSRSPRCRFWLQKAARKPHSSCGSLPTRISKPPGFVRAVKRRRRPPSSSVMGWQWFVVSWDLTIKNGIFMGYSWNMYGICLTQLSLTDVSGILMECLVGDWW